MYIELLDLVWLMLIAGGVLLWYRGLQVKELALQQVKHYCDRLDLQLLDQTIMLRGLGLKRAQDGYLKLVRRYQFEFTTTGDERYRGQITLLGRTLESIESDAHKI